MPETQVMVFRNDSHGSSVKVVTAREEEKFTPLDRNISWDVDRAGNLTHRSKVDRICFGIDVLWRSLMGLAALYMLIIGAIFHDGCPLESWIPIFMIVEGVFLLPASAFAVLMSRPDRGLNGLWKLIAALVCFPVLFFLLAWSIAGKKIKKDSED